MTNTFYLPTMITEDLKTYKTSRSNNQKDELQEAYGYDYYADRPWLSNQNNMMNNTMTYEQFELLRQWAEPSNTANDTDTNIIHRSRDDCRSLMTNSKGYDTN